MSLSEYPAPSSSPCPYSSCQLTCALEVIDSLLAALGASSGETLDLVLDLRCLLRQNQDAEVAMDIFCQLRRALEERHYLAFFRLRRCLESQIEARVRLSRAAPEVVVPVRMNRYCTQGIRHECLRAAVVTDQPVLAPRVRFAFRSGVNSSSSV